MKNTLANILKGEKVLEIGSADGELASYIKSLGYDITASDVADDYSIGIDRYFRYYLKEDMDTIISKTNFKIF